MATLTLDDKPWWVGALVGVVLFAGILYGVKYYVITPIEEQIHDAEGRIAELDKKIEQGRAAERKLPQFREEVRRLQLELDKLRRILPSTRNTEELIQKIKSRSIIYAYRSGADDWRAAAGGATAHLAHEVWRAAGW